ncbi:alpha/beta hydrolase [Desulforhopalus sp. 52FAK]
MTRLKAYIPSIFQRVSLILVLVCFFCTGCALIKLKEEEKKSQESTSIIGRIHTNVLGNGPIIVAACSTNGDYEIAHYTVLHGSGEYELMVGQGEYYVFAYRDKNSNLMYEEGEPAGQHGGAKRINVPAVGVVYDIDINISDAGIDIVIPHGTEISSVKPEELRSRQAGAIVSLDDERFSEEYGAKGFWEGWSFYRQFGGNIYFLEEYDPEKIPILFIHGATGTPKGWRYFIDNIDRNRFQPWLYYYPTGARIESMSHLLLWKLTNLQTKYQFNTIYITAHSMGGLLARSFLTKYGQVFPYVDLFISLATPWGGDRMAEYGVQQSPAIVPSWIDMQPEGDFIESLYRSKLPENTSFYMFSGHRGNRNPFRSNNDGTITMYSLQDLRAQTEAKMNYVFDEDHTSIIYSKEVLAQYNIILNEFGETEESESTPRGGQLKVNVSYSYEFEGIRPRPILILRSSQNKNTDIVTYLSSNDNDKIVGPFPPGEYLASVVTMAGKTIEKAIHVTVESDTIKELDFVFTPDGAIRGCVVMPIEKDDKVVGMPDYNYRLADRKIKIDSITLHGNGVNRTLQQIEGEDINNYDWAILRSDICYNKCFGFFGLPAGDYTLTINAQGCIPSIKKYSVQPGVPVYFRTTELTPY